MRLNEAFPSNYLKAADLNGKSVTVVIAGVEMVELGQGRDKESKLLISFRGKEKQLVCNKTNATTIGKLYGDDTDDWVGQPITLAPREVEFQGEMVLAIRVSLQKPATAAVAAKPAAAKPAPAKAAEPVREPDENGPIDNDDPPF